MSPSRLYDLFRVKNPSYRRYQYGYDQWMKSLAKPLKKSNKVKS